MTEDFLAYNNIHKVTVRYKTFLLKFDAFWIKKPPIIKSLEKAVIDQELHLIKQQRILDQNKTIFNIFDLDNDKKLSILDLEWLKSNFPASTDFGQSIKKLHELYLEKNLRPKYVKSQISVKFQVF